MVETSTRKTGEAKGKAMKVILVTGGSGFLGRHLIRKLLDKYPNSEVRAVSRSENAIQRLLIGCHSRRLIPIVGDIRDVNSLKNAVRDADTIVHLAAMKHIDLCEIHPIEAITTNVIGTKNLLDLFNGHTFSGDGVKLLDHPSELNESFLERHTKLPL